jgi:hypothetical protein
MTALRDNDIRAALRVFVDEPRSSGGIVIEELGLNKGSVRVDLAVVNGIMHAYEIKSDFDSLRRLANQAEFYGKCFDRVSLVSGRKHFRLARAAVPRWWGLVCVTPGENGPTFRVVRKPKANPSRNPRALIELLWRDQTLALLERIGAADGLRSKPRDVLWDRAVERLSLDEIADEVRRHLKAKSETLGLSAR